MITAMEHCKIRAKEDAIEALRNFIAADQEFKNRIAYTEIIRFIEILYARAFLASGLEMTAAVTQETEFGCSTLGFNIVYFDAIRETVKSALKATKSITMYHAEELSDVEEWMDGDDVERATRRIINLYLQAEMWSQNQQVSSFFYRARDIFYQRCGGALNRQAVQPESSIVVFSFIGVKDLDLE